MTRGKPCWRSHPVRSGVDEVWLAERRGWESTGVSAERHAHEAAAT